VLKLKTTGFQHLLLIFLFCTELELPALDTLLEFSRKYVKEYTIQTILYC